MACSSLIRRTNRSTFTDGDELDEAIQIRAVKSRLNAKKQGTYLGMYVGTYRKSRGGKTTLGV